MICNYWMGDTSPDGLFSESFLAISDLGIIHTSKAYFEGLPEGEDSLVGARQLCDGDDASR